MFSIHADTARTWRGGQRQVLLTVLGLRERGHRTVLVAHPEGELAGRASEGHDLIRLAPRAEVDLHAAWKLSRIVKDLRPDILHAHDPHAVALASLALSFLTSGKCPGLVASRRVAFHLKGNAFSRWKYQQVNCFVAASRAIQDMLIGDGIDPDRVVTVYEGIDLHRVQGEPAANIHAEFWLPTQAPIVGAVAALTQEKGHKYLIDAAALVVREVPDARFVILGEGDLRPALERQVKELRLDKHVLLPGFRADILSFVKSFDLFVMASLFEGPGHVAARRDGLVEGDCRQRHGRNSRGGLARRDRTAGAAARRARACVRDRGAAERSRQTGAHGSAGLERVKRLFSADGMVEKTLGVYRKHAGHHEGEDGTSPGAGTPHLPARG